MDTTHTRYCIRIEIGITMLAFLLIGGASAATIKVPDDYGQIQLAIDNANPGDTIEVHSGTYERVVVNKQLTLRGFDTGGGQPIVSGININADEITLEGFIVNKSSKYYGCGAWLSDSAITVTSNNNILIGNNVSVSNFCRGISLIPLREFPNNNIIRLSNNNTLIGNNVSALEYGIYLEYSNNNTLTGNKVDVGLGYVMRGINLKYSNSNTLTDNNVTRSNAGAIYLDSSQNNMLVGNNLWNNNRGITLWGIDTSNNTVSGNIISNNGRDYSVYFGISLGSYSNNNKIFNNIFFNKSINVEFSGSNNATWNITRQSGTNIIGGPNLGGNFWGQSDGNGYSQKCIDSEPDGICDLPYEIDSNNIDYLPLSLEFPPDSTEPTTIIVLSGTEGNNDWYTSNVQVTLTASDNEGGSSVAKTEYSLDNGINWIQYLSSITVSNEGIITILYRSTDRAGNIEQTNNQMIQIDKTIPSITGNAIIPPNSEGWYNTDVTIRFNCEDTISGTVELFFDVFVNTEGESQSVNGVCSDNAGNEASLVVSDINIDKTAPSISGAAMTLPNANDWYKSDVTIQFTASDAGSGIDTVTPDTTISTEAASQSVSGIAIDKAGNSASTTFSGINIDKTIPTITGSKTPLANVNGWNNADITIHFDCDDDLSGIDSCTADTVISTEGLGQSATGMVMDNAGNEASLDILNINIDKTIPSVTISSPEAKDYLQSETLTLNFGASDILSGIDSIISSLDGTIVTNSQVIDLSTLTLGQHTLTVNSIDKAGNTATKSVTFNSIGIIPANVDFNPDTLNIASKGDTVTTYIEIFGYDVNDIDVGTVKLRTNKGEVSAQLTPTSVIDYDNDGVPDRMVKFDRQAVIGIVDIGNVVVTISGKISGEDFEGSDEVRVIGKA